MIDQGQCWAFVNPKGERTPYVIEAFEPGETMGARVRLRNLTNGRIACVTWEWMLRPEGRRGPSYWEHAEGAVAVLPERREVEPVVIFHWGSRAMIGPAGAWQRDDRVSIPARGPKHGDKGLPAFEGIVAGIAIDGLASVVQYLEEEEAA